MQTTTKGGEEGWQRSGGREVSRSGEVGRGDSVDPGKGEEAEGRKGLASR